MKTNLKEGSLVYPLTPTSISWHNIQVFGRQTAKCYDCSEGKEPSKEIIKKVSGEVKAGQLLAIMGSRFDSIRHLFRLIGLHFSGAGKTTLLNVLTARNLSEIIIKGVVRLNGKVADTKTITSLSAYIQQDDLFLSLLTVREHLVFQSLLKMGSKFTKEERNSRIEGLLLEFGLTKCADTRIGSSTSFKGISGGESKRLAFASEVLTNPSIMFCDEPTSGLDSFMAENIVNTLKKMSSQGRTIICTIHQPSSQVFELFEQLLLMADGKVAYMGPIRDAIDFFGSLGFVCPQNYNPGDFYIAQLALIPGKEVECKLKIDNVCESYRTSNYGHHMKALQSDELSADTFRIPMETCKELEFISKYKVNFCTQFTTVLWRSFLTALREPAISQIRIIQSFAIAIILGVVYWQQELDQRGVMNINGALFLLVTNMNFQNSFAVVNTFCAELPLFLREHHNGMYRVDVYFISKMLAELPIFIAIPMIFVGTYYFMVGLNPQFHHFLIAVIIGILVTQSAVSFGYLMSCLSSSATMALSLGPPILIPLLLFGGFFLNNASIPRLFAWIKYISWFYYSFEALIINQWSDIDSIKCPNITLTVPANSTGLNISLFSNHCWKTGRDVIKHFDFDENHLIRNILLLIVVTIVIRFLAFIALLFKTRNR